MSASPSCHSSGGRPRARRSSLTRRYTSRATASASIASDQPKRSESRSSEDGELGTSHDTAGKANNRPPRTSQALMFRLSTPRPRTSGTTPWWRHPHRAMGPSRAVMLVGLRSRSGWAALRRCRSQPKHARRPGTPRIGATRRVPSQVLGRPAAAEPGPSRRDR